MLLKLFSETNSDDKKNVELFSSDGSNYDIFSGKDISVVFPEHNNTKLIELRIDNSWLTSFGDAILIFNSKLKSSFIYQYDVKDICLYISNHKDIHKKGNWVIIKSQNGNFIYALNCDRVHCEVMENYHNMTMINVDGEVIYIHNANFNIIPSKLF